MWPAGCWGIGSEPGEHKQRRSHEPSCSSSSCWEMARCSAPGGTQSRSWSLQHKQRKHPYWQHEEWERKWQKWECTSYSSDSNSNSCRKSRGARPCEVSLQQWCLPKLNGRHFECLWMRSFSQPPGDPQASGGSTSWSGLMWRLLWDCFVMWVICFRFQMTAFAYLSALQLWIKRERDVCWHNWPDSRAAWESSSLSCASAVEQSLSRSNHHFQWAS